MPQQSKGSAVRWMVALVAIACPILASRALAQPADPDVLFVSDWSVCYGTLGSCQSTDASAANVEGGWSEHFQIDDPPQGPSHGTRGAWH